MDQVIKIQSASKDGRHKICFNPKRRLSLKYAREEPDGWPLVRPATPPEWAHALRVMIMRRIPKHGPIHKTKLIRYVSADIEAASDAGKIYVNAEFTEMRMVYYELKRMCNARIIRTAPIMDDPEMALAAPAIYRTEYTGRWIDLVPVTVEAVVNYLPVTNILDMMVQALIDDD